MPKYSGAAFPKMKVVIILNTNSNTINPIATINEALNANLIPFRRLSIFGMNLSKRKDLNTRIVLNDRSMLVLGKSMPKILIQDGRASSTRIRSNLFHPLDQ